MATQKQLANNLQCRIVFIIKLLRKIISEYKLDPWVCGAPAWQSCLAAMLINIAPDKRLTFTEEELRGELKLCFPKHPGITYLLLNARLRFTRRQAN